MKTETREIYRCDHCKKIYLLKRYCEAHELKCRKNPKNKQKCLEGCSYLIKKEISYTWDAYDGEHESKREILYCTKKKEGVCPYWIDGLLEEDIIGAIPNNPMPFECSLFTFGHLGSNV